jgi:phage FluMu gp28-like protein
LKDKLPDLLLPYQERLLRATRASQLTVASKSRRIGFTWGVAADAVLTSSANRRSGGMDTLYLGYNFAMAREFVECCALWARAFGKAGSDEASPGAFRIAFASGFEIAALTSRPRSLRGRQGYVVIDEAAFHDDLDGLLKAAFAMLVWGGKLLVVSTHDGAANPFNRLVEDVRGDRQPGTLVEAYFDQALADGLYRRICLAQRKVWTEEAEAAWRKSIIDFYGDGADEELFGIPRAGSGSFLPPALIERQQRPGIEVIRWSRDPAFVLLPDAERAAEADAFCAERLAPVLARMDPELPSFLGEDFGRSGDLTVIWPVQIGRDMVRRPPFVLELRQVPFAQQRQILWYVIDRLPRFSGAAMDATGNGAAIAEETATRYGMGRIRQVKISAAWYQEVTPKFRRVFEDELTELPRDLEIALDHRAIRREGGVAQIRRDDGAGPRHGDAVIAHMMAIHASQIEGSGGLFDHYRSLAGERPPTRRSRSRR